MDNAQTDKLVEDELRNHAKYAYVPAECRDAMERGALAIERLRLDGIHTCHNECQRPACALRREVADLTERLAAAEQATHHHEAEIAAAVERCAQVCDDTAISVEALIAQGKGSHGQPGYVRDDIWTAWDAKASAARSLAAAVRATIDRNIGRPVPDHASGPC